MYTNNLKIALMATVCFLFSCSKDEIIIDDIAPKLTFDKLSKNYKSGGSFTDAEILAGIKGNKTGYTLKKITNLNPNDIVTVEGDKPNLSLKMNKTGRFTASIFLQHPDKPEASVIDAVFEITNVRPIMKTWEKTFGGSNDDYGNAIRQTKDGGYIMVGSTRKSSNALYALVVKINSDGGKEWDKQFGRNSFRNIARDVVETKDGGYIMIRGETNTPTPMKAILVKLDSKANIQWEKIFTETDPEKMIATKDGGYILLAMKYHTLLTNDCLLIKIDSKGNKQWEKMYNKYGNATGPSIAQTKDGGYIIASSIYEHIGKKNTYWVVKTDSNGNKQWDKEYSSGANDNNDVPRAIIQTTDGGYIIAGDTENRLATSSDLWVVKIDNKGDKQWDKLFGISGKNKPTSIVQTKDGGYKIIATTNSKGAGLNDMLMIKINDKGDKQWDKTFGGSGEDKARFMRKTADGGYVAGGYTKSKGAGKYDSWVLKLNENGDL